MENVTRHKLYILSGLPRSGKSTWARRNAAKIASTDLGCPIVSGDAIRRVLYERRIWMPGEKLVRPHAWIMVRALFVAGHSEVIVDETNLDVESINFWKCERSKRTPRIGGEKYPDLLSVDKVRDNVHEKRVERLKIGNLDRCVADELQADVIAWKRHVIVFTTPWEECVLRANKLRNYNQRTTLVDYLEVLRSWDPRFIQDDGILDKKAGETHEFI